MSRLIAVALLAGATIVGAGAASAQTQSADRSIERPANSPVSVAKRCSGVSCLQQIPSLGVGF